MAKPMPAVFFGHGNPMNALAHNVWTEGWASMGTEMPQPKAVLSVSAHWYLPATRVTSMPNLHAYSWGRRQIKPFDWAERFEVRARELILAGDDELLVNYETLGRDARLSVPTPEHYLPLLYVLGLRREKDRPISGTIYFTAFALTSR